MELMRTQRLILREMTRGDYGALCKMLCDGRVMYAYAHAFSAEEATAWLENQLRRYREEGFGLWAVVLREGGEMIGQCGLTLQDWEGRRVPEIGYLFCKEYWHRGYATEAARACKRYAFDRLGLGEVFSIIRDNNAPSRRVAERNGMRVRGSLVKHYYGQDMPHVVYSVTREEDGAEEISVAEARDCAQLCTLDRHISAEELRACVSRARVLVYRIRGAIAGWLRYNLFWDNTPFCNMLYVKEELRGQGTGSRLLSDWEDRMRAAGYPRAMTSTQAEERAREFYLRRGYVEIGGFQPTGEGYESLLQKTLQEVRE